MNTPLDPTRKEPAMPTMTITLRHRTTGETVQIESTPAGRADFFLTHDQQDWQEISRTPVAPRPGDGARLLPGQRLER